MSLFIHIKSILKQNENFAKNGEVFKNKVVEAALKLDPSLLSILLKDERAKSTFFQEVETMLVFDKIKFQKFISNKEFLPDSFTEFKNKIGLTANREYLTEAKEVVLDFPYKDCVLEGGQTKEQQKRNEIFWNTTLAPDEIERLYEPKILINWKKYSKEGIKDVDNITENDNFIIKGNNLLVLHSLKNRFQNKIKLIYIDPPYNTGSDSFQYNDSFTHSSWLTFMKNRLEVARDLLTEDGVILVQIDNSPSSINQSPEFGYLLVLMDEIFGRSNFVTNFVWKKKGNASNTEKNIGTITESIIMFCKNFNSLSVNIQEYKRNYIYEENGVKYNLEHPVKTNDGDYERKTMQFKISTPEGDFLPPKGKRWTIGEETAKKIVSDGKYKIVDGKFKIIKTQDDYLRGNGKLYNNLLLDHGSLKSAKDELVSLGFSREEFSSPKPEILLKELIEITTKEGDLILDYHLGSGTTCAVAHKLGRRYIGIEQMDYINTLTIPRMQKVIDNDHTSFSKKINWKGGGSFIYCEVMDILKLFNINDKKNYLKLERYFKYNINKDELPNNVFENNLNILFDVNSIYPSYYEINDEDLQISDYTKKLNFKFYIK